MELLDRGEGIGIKVTNGHGDDEVYGLSDSLVVNIGDISICHWSTCPLPLPWSLFGLYSGKWW